jgi:hypothetical protein
MFGRALLVVGAASCACACADTSTVHGLSVDAVEPASGTNDMAVAIDITGSFHRPVQINFDTGETVTSIPTATLGAGPLDSVQWQSVQHISASVPAGLAAGLYDVSVTLGDETATLTNGYEVLDPPPPPQPPAPFAMTGANWLLPCIVNGTPNARACSCANGVAQQRTIAGMPGEHWHVTVHIRGVMEQMTYTGGTPDGTTGWYVGGTYGGGNNYYGITVSSPAATYFINHGPAAQSNSWIFDYQETFDVDAGATLTFNSSGQDGIQWEGVDVNDQPLSISSVTDPVQPYNGQWARIDVVGAVPF